MGQAGRHPTINARLPTGELISEIALEWPHSDTLGAEAGSIGITVVDDIGRLKKAVEVLAEQSDRGLSDALTEGSFRRSAVLPPLLESLGMTPLAWCCVDEKKFPAVEILGE